MEKNEIINKPKDEVTNKPKDEVTNKPKDEVTNKPKEIKIEISCEIVGGEEDKIEYKNRWLDLFWLSVVVAIVSFFFNDMICGISLYVAIASFIFAIPKMDDKEVFPDKYK